MVTRKELKRLIERYGCVKPYQLTDDNWFISYNHKKLQYEVFTINDGYQAPERLYMERVTAFYVRDALNFELKEHSEKD